MANENRLDLISRKALIAEYDRVHIGPPGGARKLMEEAPTVDAVEVVHGHWDEGVCTACSFDIRCIIDGEGDFENWVWCEGFDYCPNCGAKMDGGNEDV